MGSNSAKSFTKLSKSRKQKTENVVAGIKNCRNGWWNRFRDDAGGWSQKIGQARFMDVECSTSINLIKSGLRWQSVFYPQMTQIFYLNLWVIYPQP